MLIRASHTPMLGSKMPAKMFFFREIIGEDIKKN